MKIRIIVLNWNQRDATLACLRSLAAADLQGAEILVVDNGSRDGSVDAVRAAWPEQRVLALPENRGYAGGNNAGLHAALDEGADLVLLLNNDTTVSPDFLLPLLWALDATPRAAAVCSAIHRADRPEMLDVAYSDVRFSERDAVKIRGVNALPGAGFGARREVEVAIGCSLLLRAQALRDVGLFDEAYFAYHEDVDWCLRARRAGWTLLFEPYSRVFHTGSGSTVGLAARPMATKEVQADLPNAEPMPFNPVRAYLGARNLVRLLRQYATAAEKFAFALACLRELPLEYLAIVYDREGWLRLGRYGWQDAFAMLRADGRTIPSRLRSAHASGRTAQFSAYLRGLWDGVCGRPLPLERLGLTRGAAPAPHEDETK
ncbi:MAG: glycosyltransferase family 2 protein [bacterium]